KRDCICCQAAYLFSQCYGDHRDLHSFPTRRSSDLVVQREVALEGVLGRDRLHRLVRLHRALVDAARTPVQAGAEAAEARLQLLQDRKSTRLNSSHVKISYAVFCLKKKNNMMSGNHD